ncbi:Hypothetical protein OINT_1001092 [Brucella intermedia LMG 3301]|uniref:Uncharacterized protein n=2 Tax=Brucella intermedia TaxID=94625 RepID=U4V7Q3_9HYPH|nr:Hypothetical protein OINT_1001092 [Brucella intermedia LMG 3301]ERM02005.1 hypothetical protein Q644_18800 [Brucella intermedia 229E]
MTRGHLPSAQIQIFGNRSFNQRGIIPCEKMLPRPKWIVLSSL